MLKQEILDDNLLGQTESLSFYSWDVCFLVSTFLGKCLGEIIY